MTVNEWIKHIMSSPRRWRSIYMWQQLYIYHKGASEVRPSAWEWELV